MINRLLKATEEIWAQYNFHPFVKGIEDGTLDMEKFRYYVMQDYKYLAEYAKVFGVGIAKAKSAETMQKFSECVHTITEGEMNIHKGYMGRLEITRDELGAMQQALDNLSYTSYMLRIAYEDGEAEIVAAILSCAYSYEVIAQNIVKNNPDAVNHSFYGDWVKGYSSKEYSEGNIRLINLLERLTQHYTEKQKQHIEDIFVACSRYELAFWDMAWNMSK